MRHRMIVPADGTCEWWPEKTPDPLNSDPLNSASTSDAGDLVRNHCYAVTGYDTTHATFTLMNPWGDENADLTWSQIVGSYFPHIES
jgi:hypothetical protein